MYLVYLLMYMYLGTYEHQLNTWRLNSTLNGKPNFNFSVMFKYSRKYHCRPIMGTLLTTYRSQWGRKS